MNDRFHFGVISGKLGGVDGVSLEVDKWIRILSEMGHRISTVAGRYVHPLEDVPAERQIDFEPIRFDSADQMRYEKLAFPYFSSQRAPLGGEGKRALLEELTIKGEDVANRLRGIVLANEIDAIIAENTNAMPMTLLGALGVNGLVTDHRMAALFHHHDFWWERSRFSHNYIEPLLNRIMPPSEPGLEHIVISSYAAHILSSFKRLQPVVIPNCEDFEHPVRPDDYNGNFRSDFGFGEKDILVVQPTRIVRRKRIEDSLKLLHLLLGRYPAMRGRLHLIVSLYQGDEPDDNYVEEIKRTAESWEIPLHLISDRVISVRGEDEEGRRIYTNRDILVNADLVVYLPVWEGFGNALIEALAARAAVVTTTYLVYKTDIKVTGIENIEIRDKYDEDGSLVIADHTLEEIHYILTHPRERAELAERNFAVGKREFSFRFLRERIAGVVSDYGDEIRACRKRLKKANTRYSV